MAPRRRSSLSIKVKSSSSIPCSVNDAKCAFCNAMDRWINQSISQGQKRSLRRLELFLKKFSELNILYTNADPIYLVPIPANLTFAKITTPYSELLAKLDLLSLSYAEIIKHGYPHESQYPGYATINQGYYKKHAYSGISGSCLFEQHECSRCSTVFCYHDACHHESCRFHACKSVGGIHACCNQPEWSPGCKLHNTHVWAGIAPGTNYYPAFNNTIYPLVSTCSIGKLATVPHIYAVDCEMVYTKSGLELAKVSIVTLDGIVVYNEYVEPEEEVIDYNTRYSGITAKNLIAAKTLHQVQSDIMQFVHADSYLIGHALNNDLRALKLIHLRCVDTSIIFKNPSGSQRKPSLKTLANSILQTSIQTGTNGHDSVEDATITMKLVMKAVQNDFNYQHYLNTNRQ